MASGCDWTLNRLMIFAFYFFCFFSFSTNCNSITNSAEVKEEEKRGVHQLNKRSQCKMLRICFQPKQLIDSASISSAVSGCVCANKQ